MFGIADFWSSIPLDIMGHFEDEFFWAVNSLDNGLNRKEKYTKNTQLSIQTTAKNCSLEYAHGCA